MKPSEQRPAISAARANRVPRATALKLRRDAAARVRLRDQAAREARPRLREWHALSRADRTAAWNELVLWTTWLYDRYGLGSDWRLPDCWPQHPGIIEELWLLKIWREEIYDGASEIPLNQQAGAWHAHLQAFTGSVKTFYAPGCRSGHKTPSEVAWNGRLQEDWAKGDPSAGIPLPYLLHPGVAVTEALTITADAMEIAFASGHAERRLPTLPDFCVYDGKWWKRCDDVWRCLDAYPELRADIDDYEKRAAKANTAAARLRELLAGGEAPSLRNRP
jgi:hypothetical protein